jgi:signal transduction histidine kinase/CheY-like chemotaxis protein/streptogramin lyase
VTSFADAGEQRVWIGELGGGLTRFDPATGQSTDLDTAIGRTHALPDQRVMALRRDRLGNLWIGTMTAGLARLSTDNTMKLIPALPGDPHGLSSPGVMTLFESRSGTIWIGTHGGGANAYYPDSGLVRQLPHGAGQIGAVSAQNVTAFAEDSRGNLWIGTDGGGLDLAHADGFVVKVFRHQLSDPNSLPANTVYALAIDSQDRVWIATDGGGLAQIRGNPADPNSLRFDVISREQGLSSDTVYGVLPDAAGRLWLSGNAGLTRYDPHSRTIKTYHSQHGLQGEEFNYGASERLADGRLCFGGPGGFNIFDPARVSDNRIAPRLALTRVSVMGVPTTGPRSSWLLDRINLDFRANVVTLDFAALDFISPKRNRIAYRMSGLTDRWIDLGAQHRVTLTNLDAGDHLLEVRAANADSVWSHEPLQFMIHRAPVPWRSPWAYSAYIILALLLVAQRIHRHQQKFRRIVRQQQQLEAEVAVRTRELRESNHQLGEAVEARARFMDRMSHELRTPMNGVLGMAELLSRTPLSATQARLTQSIRSSGEVLLHIVNDLLDFSKLRAGKVDLEQLPLELVRILEDCASLFAGAAENQKLELIVCPPPREIPGLLGDQLRLRQILMNLIGNAVKFTARGEIVVRAELQTRDPQSALLRLAISDTGIGMDADTMSRIFTPFTQADESTTRRFGGTGLGLAICRELTHLMGGTLQVESEPGVGSTFRVSLPLKIALNASSTGHALPGRSVRVLTPHRTTGESLARHVTALGLTMLSVDDNIAEACDRRTADVFIVDSLMLAEYMRVSGEHQRSSALIVLASEHEAQSGRLGAIDHPHTVVLRPVRRESVYEALALATGAKTPDTSETVVLATIADRIGGRVLLVEDEAVNAAVAQGYLEELGCECVWARTGDEAVAREAAEAFDLILMDLSMPGLDGIGATALIREQQRSRERTPIIALTAHNSVKHQQRIRQAGMDDILCKPCTLEEFEGVLRRWISSPRRKNEETDAPAALPAARDREWTLIDEVSVARLRRLRNGAQPDLYQKLLGLFLSGSPQMMSELQAAMQAGNLKAAAAVCHKFASSCANVGALAFSQAVRELEQLCLAHAPESAASLQERIQAALPLLLRELQQQAVAIA